MSDAKTVMPVVKQPVFLRSMSAPSDLEMIANQDLEFTHASQRYLSVFCLIIVLLDHHRLEKVDVSLYLQEATPPYQSS